MGVQGIVEARNKFAEGWAVLGVKAAPIADHSLGKALTLGGGSRRLGFLRGGGSWGGGGRSRRLNSISEALEGDHSLPLTGGKGA